LPFFLATAATKYSHPFLGSKAPIKSGKSIFYVMDCVSKFVEISLH